MIWLQRLLLIIGIVALGLYGFFTIQARLEQNALEKELYQPRPMPVQAASRTRAAPLREGDLFGRLEVPRLNMSVMVMEGISARTLRLGAGHIPGTVLGIAAHRDTFFQPLKDIKKDDKILFTTVDGTSEFQVVATKIVKPTDTYVLEELEPRNTLTLVTCYPFHYIGPAPKRFIVQAVRNAE
jgi:sortase A